MMKPILTISCLLTLLFSACSPYDDGPLISLRSRAMRMNFERPLTLYESNGIDSTEIANQIFLDSIQGFNGRFWFTNESSSSEWQGIIWGSRKEGDPDGGVGSYIPNDDYTLIWLNMPPLYHWRINWTVKRLSHRDLWLESPDGKKLRFEE